jgi:hypothetical protein
VLRFRTLIRRARLLGLGLVVSIALAAPSSAQAGTPGSPQVADDNGSAVTTQGAATYHPNRSSWT